VSRSSALASKATGFPIAKIAAKLAVGYTLPEIPNDITGETPASFEPTIDYVVTKVPRFAFEKFPGAKDVLGPQMKSVGETMAIGRTFEESFQKALRSLETGHVGLDIGVRKMKQRDRQQLIEDLSSPHAERIFTVAAAYRAGMSTEDIFLYTKIDPWFLEPIRHLVEAEEQIRAQNPFEMGFTAE